ncbi:MAG TPA: DUF5134 domain-containing protein [Streptosporangiaceae bacterium]|nr:DUF5134 domain-containing protein [Streptosporangiaceae bacterium]
MTGIPGFILDFFAALMLLVAAVSAGRLALDRPWRRNLMDADIDGAHVLMGIAMAGMLVASLTTLSNGAWTVIFAVMTAWFAWFVYRESRGGGVRVLVDSHHSPHLVHSAAMVYMFAAVTAPAAGHGSGMGGMGGAGGGMSTLAAPVLAFIFAILLVGYAVVDLDRLSGPAPHGSYLSAAGAVPAGAAMAGAAAGGGTFSPGSASASAVRPEGGVATLPEQAASPVPSAGAAGHGGGSVRDLLLNPRTAAGCRIAMGVTMAFMLVIMI